MLAALDYELAALQRKECASRELPLAVRRFQAFMDAPNPISAIARATANVLASYAAVTSCDTQRISASALCLVCGLSLEGEPTRRRTAGPMLSNESGHTGALRLDPGGSRILLPDGIDVLRGRVAVGHEIGHYIIHQREHTIDTVTSRLPSTPEEEALSEYAGRLLLMPDSFTKIATTSNLALSCLEGARRADVTLHAAAARLGDPDSPFLADVRGLILWRMNPQVPASQSTASRLTPHWHLCRDAFVPVRRCHAGSKSLVGELAGLAEERAVASRIERVEIGSLKGIYRVDAVAWGSVGRGTRTVLSVFVQPG